MYRHIIEFKDTLPAEDITNRISIANEAFDNRGGKIAGIKKGAFIIVFEGDETKYGCLSLGMLALEKNKDFLECVKCWNYEDEEEPDENCDVLEVFALPIK